MLIQILLLFIVYPLKVINYLRRRIQKKVSFENKYIISVGNLSFGGSGKTPLVISLCNFLREYNIETAVFLRGYKSFSENTGGEVKNTDRPDICGDEALVLKRNLKNIPVFVGKDRVENMRKLKNKDIKVFMMDDGFQYFKVKKDLDILIYNPNLPDILSRDFYSELKRADIVFFNPPQQRNKRGFYNYKMEFDGIYNKKERFLEYENFEFLAFCGIGNPLSFKRVLEKNDIKIKKFLIFPDHYNYKNSDIKMFMSYKLPMITTEKDFVKIDYLKIPGLYYLKIKVELKNSFKKLLLKKIKNDTSI